MRAAGRQRRAGLQRGHGEGGREQAREPRGAAAREPSAGTIVSVGGRERLPYDLHAHARPCQHAGELRREGEAEEEARDHVGDVVGERLSRHEQEGSRRVARPERPRVDVHHLLRGERARSAAQRELDPPEAPAREPADDRPGKADHPPGGHLPGRLGALAEQDVGGERPERADREAGQRAERDSRSRA